MLSDDELVALGNLLTPEARQYIDARLERLKADTQVHQDQVKKAYRSFAQSVTDETASIRGEVEKLQRLLGTPPSIARLRDAIELLAAFDRGEIKLPNKGG